MLRFGIYAGSNPVAQTILVMREYVEFEVLKGKTLREVRESRDQLVFVTEDDETYVQYHDQDCCESVDVEDICGDLNDLIGSPILLAEESTSEDVAPEDRRDDHCMWTFYKLSTNKGSVTIRWFGSSNGYYSVEVSMRKD